MSAKHTPGPWVANTINAVESRIGESRREAGLATGNTIVSTVADEWIALAQVATHCEGLKSGEGLANARLIAAAPNLLEALKNIVGDLEMRSKNGVVDCSNGVYFDAHAAIAMAHGWSS